MSSNRIINGDNTTQIVSFTQLIFITEAAITQNLAFNNPSVVPDLVEQLETLLEPYRDKEYDEDLKRITDTNLPRGNTPSEVSRNQRQLKYWVVKEKHKALMRLAKRAKLLPIKGAPSEL